MQAFAHALGIIEGLLWANWFPMLLVGVGVFFTIYLKFPQLRYLGMASRFVRGKYDKPGAKGDTTHFQALATALSGTVGTGNIAGVAFALHLGGPAALFWMLVTALFGMTTKFVEVTLSHKYRETDSQGFVSGGPMYYMKNRLNLKWLAGFTALMTIISSIGTGNMPQINSIADAVRDAFGFERVITGAILSVLLALVILGGITRIAKVTEKLVPAMAVIYFAGAVGIIIYNYQNIVPSFVSIFRDVFGGGAAPLGGFLGASFAFSFKKGVNRGLFSNEAGQGSAPIAHASARTSESVSEGLVSMLEPFIDTIIICTLTGLVILSSGVWKEKIPNTFEKAETHVVDGLYDQNDPDDRADLRSFYLKKKTSKVEATTGEITVLEGKIQSPVTILHGRSLAEQVIVYTRKEGMRKKSLFTGSLDVQKGQIVQQSVTLFLEGKSLIHSAPLTTEAFTRSFFGRWGKLIVAVCLTMFAFSTTVSWAYYGGRAINFLFGVKGLLPYRLLYCLAFFLASFIDTTIVWTMASIAIVLMTLPNLIGMLLLHKEVKISVREFWVRFKKEHPHDRIPEKV